MSEAIEFDAKEAAETERSYLTADVTATRAVVMELLAPGPGERVLDVGSGPGLLLRDIAGAVGPLGLAGPAVAGRAFRPRRLDAGLRIRPRS
jgi:hypothetical protein